MTTPSFRELLRSIIEHLDIMIRRLRRDLSDQLISESNDVMLGDPVYDFTSPERSDSNADPVMLSEKFELLSPSDIPLRLWAIWPK
jgi:hypothetical protein